MTATQPDATQPDEEHQPILGHALIAGLLLAALAFVAFAFAALSVMTSDSCGSGDERLICTAAGQSVLFYGQVAAGPLVGIGVYTAGIVRRSVRGIYLSLVALLASQAIFLMAASVVLGL